VCGVLSAV